MLKHSHWTCPSSIGLFILKLDLRPSFICNDNLWLLTCHFEAGPSTENVWDGHLSQLKMHEIELHLAWGKILSVFCWYCLSSLRRCPSGLCIQKRRSLPKSDQRIPEKNSFGANTCPQCALINAPREWPCHDPISDYYRLSPLHEELCSRAILSCNPAKAPV